MKTTELNPKNLDVLARTVPAHEEIVMVNLLRYRTVATYAAGHAKANAKGEGGAPLSGREAYFGGYVPAFAEVAAELGVGTKVTPTFIGNVRSQLVAPTDEAWDDVVLVHYESFATFRAIVESAAYQADADPHRQAALEDWRLIATVKGR